MSVSVPVKKIETMASESDSIIISILVTLSEEAGNLKYV